MAAQVRPLPSCTSIELPEVLADAVRAMSFHLRAGLKHPRLLSPWMFDAKLQVVFRSKLFCTHLCTRLGVL